MIKGYSSPTYGGVSVADLLLFIIAVPFGVCDLYYSYRDYSCVWIPIQNTAIKFPLQTWLRVDGGVLLGMATLILICGLILCCNPLGCQGFFWFHNILTWLLSLFRLAWLIIGAVMFWGYLNKFPLCANPVRRYMWANLIIGFITSFFYFLMPCLCGLLEKPAVGGVVPGVGIGGAYGTYGQPVIGSTGFGTDFAMQPLPVTTPTIRETYSTKFLY